MRSTPNDQSDAPWARPAGQLLAGLRRSPAGWWVVLWLFWVLALVWPGVPVAGYSPLLSITIAALSGAGGVLLLTFGLLRFQARGAQLDLLTAVAFGALALANLTTGVVAPIVEDPPTQPAVALLFVILQRALAGGLFLAGLAQAGRSVASAQRARVAAGATASVAAESL